MILHVTNNAGVKTCGTNDQGKVLNIMMVDEKKEKIKAVAFGAAATKFATILQVFFSLKFLNFFS